MEALTQRAGDEKLSIYKYLHEIKLNIIKTLNGIVNNYRFVDRTKPSFEGRINQRA